MDGEIRYAGRQKRDLCFLVENNSQFTIHRVFNMRRMLESVLSKEYSSAIKPRINSLGMQSPVIQSFQESGTPCIHYPSTKAVCREYIEEHLLKAEQDLPWDCYFSTHAKGPDESDPAFELVQHLKNAPETLQLAAGDYSPLESVEFLSCIRTIGSDSDGQPVFFDLHDAFSCPDLIFIGPRVYIIEIKTALSENDASSKLRFGRLSGQLKRNAFYIDRNFDLDYTFIGIIYDEEERAAYYAHCTYNKETNQLDSTINGALSIR